MDERSPWERLPDEPSLWFGRFERYRLLGPDRSVSAAYNQWRGEKGRRRSTKTPENWAAARDRWDWIARAQAWDEHEAAEVASRVEAERIEVLTSGYALQFERVRELGELAAVLAREARDPELRWSAGRNGDQFASGLVRELRGTLDDIAREMGERAQGVRVTGKDGGPVDVALREVVVNLSHGDVIEPEQEPVED